MGRAVAAAGAGGQPQGVLDAARAPGSGHAPVLDPAQQVHVSQDVPDLPAVHENARRSRLVSHGVQEAVGAKDVQLPDFHVRRRPGAQVPQLLGEVARQLRGHRVPGLRQRQQPGRHRQRRRGRKGRQLRGAARARGGALRVQRDGRAGASQDAG